MLNVSLLLILISGQWLVAVGRADNAVDKRGSCWQKWRFMGHEDDLGFAGERIMEEWRLSL